MLERKRDLISSARRRWSARLVELRVQRHDAAVRVLELAVETRQLLLALAQLLERAQQLLILLLHLVERVAGGPAASVRVRRADVGGRRRAARRRGRIFFSMTVRAAGRGLRSSHWSIRRCAPMMPSPMPVVER